MATEAVGRLFGKKRTNFGLCVDIPENSGTFHEKKGLNNFGSFSPPNLSTKKKVWELFGISAPKPFHKKKKFGGNFQDFGPQTFPRKKRFGKFWDFGAQTFPRKKKVWEIGKVNFVTSAPKPFHEKQKRKGLDVFSVISEKHARGGNS